jgi:protein-arginine kinase
MMWWLTMPKEPGTEMMTKIILHIPEPKIRKKFAPMTKVVKSKKLYSRKGKKCSEM